MWYHFVQVVLLYKGILKMMLVLLHDFPEFLCDYHFSLCDVIPATCIQLRNLILSAFPRNMRLPDPSTPNLKVCFRLTGISNFGELNCHHSKGEHIHSKGDINLERHSEFLSTQKSSSPSESITCIFCVVSCVIVQNGD